MAKSLPSDALPAPLLRRNSEPDAASAFKAAAEAAAHSDRASDKKTQMKPQPPVGSKLQASDTCAFISFWYVCDASIFGRAIPRSKFVLLPSRSRSGAPLLPPPPLLPLPLTTSTALLPSALRVRHRLLASAHPATSRSSSSSNIAPALPPRPPPPTAPPPPHLPAPIPRRLRSPGATRRGLFRIMITGQSERLLSRSTFWNLSHFPSSSEATHLVFTTAAAGTDCGWIRARGVAMRSSRWESRYSRTIRGVVL